MTYKATFNLRDGTTRIYTADDELAMLAIGLRQNWSKVKHVELERLDDNRDIAEGAKEAWLKTWALTYS